MGAVQYWRVAVGATLGGRAIAGGISSGELPRDCGGQLGLGPRDRCRRHRNGAPGVGRLMCASPLIGLWLRMPHIGSRGEEAEVLDDPKVRLALTGRSGPLVVEIEYRVTQENARAFHNVLLEVQLSRQRNGAYGWSIARDIADPELWIERFHCPTWLDYLRQHNRSTKLERALDQEAVAFHIGPTPVRIRHMLERPFGSARWKEDAPDRGANKAFQRDCERVGSTGGPNP